MATNPEPQPTGDRSSILVVDDDRMLVEVVSRYLARSGHRPRGALNGREALGRAAEDPPALVILDLGLPDIDGLEVMRQLRDRHGVPVIVLSAKGREDERVLGLRLGADDYVPKPFHPEELMARVDGILRRTGSWAERDRGLRFGDLHIDPRVRRVSVAGTDVALARREYELLLFLARHPGRAFTREQLLETVWQYSFYGDTSTVTVHVRRLRAKLGENTAAGRLIKTVRGVGYRFQEVPVSPGEG